MGLLSPISYLEKYFHVKETRAKPKEAGQGQAVQMSWPPKYQVKCQNGETVGH